MSALRTLLLRSIMASLRFVGRALYLVFVAPPLLMFITLLFLCLLWRERRI